MITRIEAINYKCFQYISQDLKRFQVLVGPNGSGKSTFLDIIRLISDFINYGFEYTVYKNTNSLNGRVEYLRELFFHNQGNKLEFTIDMKVPNDLIHNGYKFCRYELSFICNNPTCDNDSLTIIEKFILKHSDEIGHKINPSLFGQNSEVPDTILLDKTDNNRYIVSKNNVTTTYLTEIGSWKNPFKIPTLKSSFANLPEDYDKFKIALWARDYLKNGIKWISLNSSLMKNPVYPDIGYEYNTEGSNLPLIIEKLKEDKKRAWIKHLQTVIPDLIDVSVKQDQSTYKKFLLVDYDGFQVPSWLLSDGTLRFLALTLLAYVETSGVYCIEEPENGIHPKAIESLYDSLSSVYKGQVFLATHSPLIVAKAKLSELLCFTRNKQGASSIIFGDLHPNLIEWKQNWQNASLHDLYINGVLDSPND